MYCACFYAVCSSCLLFLSPSSVTLDSWPALTTERTAPSKKLQQKRDAAQYKLTFSNHVTRMQIED